MPLTLVFKISLSTDFLTSIAQVIIKFDEIDGGKSDVGNKLLKN